MKCPNGHENVDSASFCAVCGLPMRGASEAVMPSQAVSATATHMARPDVVLGGRYWLTLALVVFIVGTIATVLGHYIFLSVLLESFERQMAPWEVEYPTHPDPLPNPLEVEKPLEVKADEMS